MQRDADTSRQEVPSPWVRKALITVLAATSAVLLGLLTNAVYSVHGATAIAISALYLGVAATASFVASRPNAPIAEYVPHFSTALAMSAFGLTTFLPDGERRLSVVAFALYALAASTGFVRNRGAINSAAIGMVGLFCVLYNRRAAVAETFGNWLQAYLALFVVGCFALWLSLLVVTRSDLRVAGDIALGRTERQRAWNALALAHAGPILVIPAVWFAFEGHYAEATLYAVPVVPMIFVATSMRDFDFVRCALWAVPIAASITGFGALYLIRGDYIPATICLNLGLASLVVLLSHLAQTRRGRITVDWLQWLIGQRSIEGELK